MRIRNSVVVVGAAFTVASAFLTPLVVQAEEAEQDKKPWEVLDLSGGGVSGNGQTEQSAGQINGGSLTSTWEGIKGSPQYENIESVVDNNEQILMDMESRISALENMGPGGGDVWIEEPPTTAGGTATAGNMFTTIWTPNYVDQTESFIQSREVEETRSSPVEVYEYNPSTGERRLVDSYTDTKTVNYSQTRQVSINISTEPVTEQQEVTYYGYTYMADVPVVENCRLDPPPGSVNAGTYYSATQTCDHHITETRVARAEDVDTPNAYDYVEIGNSTENVWEPRDTIVYATGTKPVAAECVDNTALSGFSSETFISYSPSFRIATSNWKNQGIWQYSNVSGYPTRENPMTRGDGYHYWSEGSQTVYDGSNSANVPTVICRMPASSNTDFGGSTISGTPAP